MIIERMDGQMLKSMLISGAALIADHKKEINELNVFPVPDGDTGTNMSMTLEAAVNRLSGCEETSLDRVAEIIAAALLRGARGNSGVILSLLFRGLSKGLAGASNIGGYGFAAAFQEGVNTAYSAVLKPANGTILSVSRFAAERALEFAGASNEIEPVLETLLREAEAALRDTIEQNPVLKKANVVDAGAKGLCFLLEGMLLALRGMPAEFPQDDVPDGGADFSDFSNGDITFAYCTEFIVEIEDRERDPVLFRAYLETIGDSLVFVDAAEIIKVHIHTNNPGAALEEAVLFGPLSTVKIENMRNQHTERVLRSAGSSRAKERGIAPPEQKYGFVSVCVGEGVGSAFRDLGVNRIVDGGQTMNPSTEDILVAVDKTPAEIVFVLPNNKNIIMAAEQCAPLSTEKRVIVIPSTSVQQGITAMLSFDPSVDPEKNRSDMTASLKTVRSGHLTYAVRNSSVDGRDIKEGDYLALCENKLFASGRDEDEMLRLLAGELCSGAEFITIFYGCDVDESAAKKAEKIFSEACPQGEINLLYGGQPTYFYIISAE